MNFEGFLGPHAGVFLGGGNLSQKSPPRENFGSILKLLGSIFDVVCEAAWCVKGRGVHSGVVCEAAWCVKRRGVRSGVVCEGLLNAIFMGLSDL